MVPPVESGELTYNLTTREWEDATGVPDGPDRSPEEWIALGVDPDVVRSLFCQGRRCGGDDRE